MVSVSGSRPSYSLRAPRPGNRSHWCGLPPQFRLRSALLEFPGNARATSHSPVAPVCIRSQQPSSLLQISSRQPELMEHRAEQARAEFFFAVLQRRKPVAIVESPVTALAGATVEGNGHPTDAAEPSDFSLELMARHIHGSHISVRFSSHGWDLAARVKKIDQPPVSSRRTIAAPAASAFNLAKARSRGMYFMPQSGAGISRSGGRCVRAAR